VGELHAGSFGAAVPMVAIALYHLPVDIQAKGYLGMGVVLVAQTAISLTRTIRDNEEAR
jgi:hypothetical protein